MTTACKNGSCEILFDENKQCDFRVTISAAHVCRYICPATGRCMHAVANKPKRKKGTHVWAEQNNAAFNEYRARRGEP